MYTVRTQAEMDDATRRGRCVKFSTEDLHLDAQDETIVRIAVILESEESAVNLARLIASNLDFHSRSPSIFPTLLVQAPASPIVEIRFFSCTDEAKGFPIDAPSSPSSQSLQRSIWRVCPYHNPFRWHYNPIVSSLQPLQPR